MALKSKQVTTDVLALKHISYSKNPIWGLFDNKNMHGIGAAEGNRQADKLLTLDASHQHFYKGQIIACSATVLNFRVYSPSLFFLMIEIRT